MTAATITHMQTRAFTDGGPEVSDTITGTVSIPEELFVNRTEDDVFSHFASVADLMLWPSVKDPTQQFYRTATCTRVFKTITQADEFATLMRRHFRQVVKDWDAAQVFVGTTTETIP